MAKLRRRRRSWVLAFLVVMLVGSASLGLSFALSEEDVSRKNLQLASFTTEPITLKITEEQLTALTPYRSLGRFGLIY